MWVREVIFCHPSSLLLSALLARPFGAEHRGRAAHFQKRMGYRKMAEIKRSTKGGCVMNYSCPPLFGVCLVFYNMVRVCVCVYVCTEVLDVFYHCFKDLSE